MGVPVWPAVDNSKTVQYMHIDVTTKSCWKKPTVTAYLFLEKKKTNK